jgi:hypothetical protein
VYVGNEEAILAGLARVYKEGILVHRRAPCKHTDDWTHPVTGRPVCRVCHPPPIDYVPLEF